jgi:D-alanyl-D-alanine carboxypeptidase
MSSKSISNANGNVVNQLRATLIAAADELVNKGFIGVAACIDLPKLRSPIKIAAGHADIERTQPLTGNETFAIASQSKMFTGAMTVLLAKDGAIELAHPLTRYVQDIPAVDAAATIEQFLNHTGGIGNFLRAVPTLPYPLPRMSYDDLMALARAQGRQFAPGTGFEYNNTDVVVLARLCERVTGKSRSELLRERLFAPLGMKDTHIAVGEEWPRRGMARGYYQPSQGYAGPPIDVSLSPDFSVASAAGDIVSSLDDMLRWARDLASGGALTGVSLADVAASIAQARPFEPNWFFPRVYGRGVERWSWGGRPFWGHRGSFFGYHSGTFLDPVSGGAFSMFSTMCTQGSFMSFVEREAHDYMAFMGECANIIIRLAEML